MEPPQASSLLIPWCCLSISGGTRVGSGEGPTHMSSQAFCNQETEFWGVLLGSGYSIAGLAGTGKDRVRMGFSEQLELSSTSTSQLCQHNYCAQNRDPETSAARMSIHTQNMLPTFKKKKGRSKNLTTSNHTPLLCIHVKCEKL